MLRLPQRIRLFLTQSDPLKSAPTIEEKRQVGESIIDRAAGASRLEFITDVPGQNMVYKEKAEEAIAYMAIINASGTPNDVDYPHIAAEVGISGIDMVAVATTFIAKAGEWKALSAFIEGQRVGAKQQISAAADEAAIRTIINACTWPTNPEND